MNEPESEALQRLDRALRELPPLRAPSTLEARVLGELSRRKQLAWWRRSFGHWPLPARAAFLTLCLCLTGVTCLGVAAGFEALQSLSLTHQILSTLGAAADLAAVIMHIAPPGWAYAALALGGALYAVLFGLSAVVYHSLYLQPIAGDR
jgi:hypothetical protein